MRYFKSDRATFQINYSMFSSDKFNTDSVFECIKDQTEIRLTIAFISGQVFTRDSRNKTTWIYNQTWIGFMYCFTNKIFGGPWIPGFTHLNSTGIGQMGLISIESF